MVSPSGIAVFFFRRGPGDNIRVRRVDDAAHLISSRGRDKPAFFEIAAQEMIAGRLVVDSRDQQTGPAALKPNRHSRQFLRKMARDLAAVRLVFGQEYPDRRIPASKES